MIPSHQGTFPGNRVGMQARHFSWVHIVSQLGNERARQPLFLGTGVHTAARGVSEVWTELGIPAKDSLGTHELLLILGLIRPVEGLGLWSSAMLAMEDTCPADMERPRESLYITFKAALAGG